MTVLPGGAMLGVLGGGQLGRMFVHAAQAQGFRVTVLEPDPASPAGAAADAHLQAPYDDPTALDILARTCSAVTTEFENVPAAVLQSLAAVLPVAPPAGAVDICQHRVREKRCFIDAGVPCAPHAVISTAADAAAQAIPTPSPRASLPSPPRASLPSSPSPCASLQSSPTAVPLFPGLLKTATLGYDGKSQMAVAQAGDLPAAWAALGSVPCVLEARLPLRHEISAIVARGRNGQMVHLPVQQNLHRNGVLAVTQVPAAGVDAATAADAIAQARRLATALQYVGVLCVEFFVLDDGQLVANEMAPRPHNSGHHSIDSCDVSQFDLQLRTLAGLPLVQPRLHSPAVMLNLLGDLWFDGSADSDQSSAATGRNAANPRQPDWPAVLALPGAHLHLYGKAEPRPGRKMGHLTVTAADAATARAVALQAAARLGLPAF